MLTRSIVLAMAFALLQAIAGSVILAGDFYVAPNGSDSGGGTSNAPFQTIQKGIDSASHPGDTLTILPGTYREELVVRSQGTADKPIVIKAAKNQAVIVDGSQRVQGWRLIDKEQNLWGVDFGDKAPYMNDNGRWDMPPRSEQVFVGDKRCTHLKEGTAAADMSPYSFTATLTTPAKYTLKLPEGIDPNTARTDITVLSKLLDVVPSASHLVIDGIDFRRARNSYRTVDGHSGDMAVVKGEAIEVKNCVFEYSSGGRGLDLGCSRSHIHDNIIRFNGELGLAFHGEDDVFENNLVQGNDQAGYGSWETGGTKIVGNGHIIRGNRFIDNLGGVAIWLDVAPCNIIIERNYVSGNHGEGIRIETSFHTYVGYNIVENTQPCTYTTKGETHTSPGVGISVQNSAETLVCNNFLKDNHGADIQLFNYHRRAADVPKFQDNYPDEKHRQWLQRSRDADFVYDNDNLIYNNVIMQTTPQTSHACIWFRGGYDQNIPQWAGNRIDYNFYWNTVTHAPTVQLGSSSKEYNGAEVPQGSEVPDGDSQWQTHYGFDTHSLGGFKPADYEHSPFSSKYPYIPTADFAGIGKGKVLDVLSDYRGHTDVDYLGHLAIVGGATSMGHIEYQGK